tara:strand:+ start:356 stop:2212 length:1857 start_codon:yes stop_codon:yes gene_type:complete
MAISKTQKTEAIVAAIGKSQAMIEFELDGTIVDANENFLGAVGYSIDEIRGRHHSMFVEPAYRESKEYAEFWEKLGRGEYEAGQYKRIGKDDKEIWIQASYNPILDRKGKAVRVIKFATDITAQTLQNADFSGKIDAIGKSQAVIEFELDGTIIDANENFLGAVGYTIDEIRGRHHSMFVEPAYRESKEYKEFWEKLGKGEYEAAQYKRIGKGGKEIWIQASYNPILDPDGSPIKVVKFATDITAQTLQNADFSGQIGAISKSQAVIEFELDGTIIDANENFLGAVGYTIDEIRGQHHRMFVEPAYAESAEYSAFWKNLAAGQFEAAEYKRIGKGGKEIWIQASYNPILDPDGSPFKVVKYATDITADMLRRQQAEQVAAQVDANLDKIVHSVTAADERTSSASSASNQTSTTVQAVASASEELDAAAREIAESMTRSKAQVEQAMTEAQRADESTQSLSNATEALNGINALIQDIAGQINLLALNATIEAARAGDAGKGFAVVATEVKSLADQVSGATGQISSEIENMHKVSGDVVEGLSEIQKAIEAVEHSVTASASAVEEQSATTREISTNMQTASSAIQEVDSGLAAIVESIGLSREAATEGLTLYRSLNGTAA